MQTRTYVDAETVMLSNILSQKYCDCNLQDFLMEASNIVVAHFYIIKVNLCRAFAVSGLKIAKINNFLVLNSTMLSIQ